MFVPTNEIYLSFVHKCNFEIHCVCEEPLSPEKNISALHKEIQRGQASGKLYMRACFVVWTVLYHHWKIS